MVIKKYVGLIFLSCVSNFVVCMTEQEKAIEEQVNGYLNFSEANTSKEFLQQRLNNAAQGLQDEFTALTTASCILKEEKRDLNLYANAVSACLTVFFRNKLGCCIQGQENLEQPDKRLKRVSEKEYKTRIRRMSATTSQNVYLACSKQFAQKALEKMYEDAG